MIRKWKRWLIAGIGFCLVVLILVLTADADIRHRAQGRLFDDVTAIPVKKVGLLLGTGKYLANGSVNPYYAYRIDAAEQLLRAGKIRYLVISGDNSRESYNEPEMMRRDLMARGIDSSVVYLDFAGFRTFDSMIRLKDVFGQTQVTVISQPFHNERALYIASRRGIEAIGFNARDLPASKGWKVALREKGARVKVFLDLWFGKTPKFLGEPVVLPN